MKNKKTIGNIGEILAIKYLNEKGYNVCNRNFYCKYGEIDIIARFENTMIFLEVKTRTNLLYGFPSDAVNYEKIMHIKNSARYYLYKNKIYNMNIRFDVIEVYLKGSRYVVNHIKDVID